MTTKPDLPLADLKAIEADLSKMGSFANALPHILGPTYGAAWCDRALTLDRAVWALRTELDEELRRFPGAWSPVWPEASVWTSEPVPAAQHRHDLTGQFPADTPVKKHLWPKLTFTEHCVIGDALKDHNRYLCHLRVRLTVYPNAHPLCKAVETVIKRLTKLRCGLDDIACREMRTLTVLSPVNVYYGDHCRWTRPTP